MTVVNRPDASRLVIQAHLGYMRSNAKRGRGTASALSRATPLSGDNEIVVNDQQAGEPQRPHPHALLRVEPREPWRARTAIQ